MKDFFKNHGADFSKNYGENFNSDFTSNKNIKELFTPKNILTIAIIAIIGFLGVYLFKKFFGDIFDKVFGPIDKIMDKGFSALKTTVKGLKHFPHVASKIFPKSHHTKHIHGLEEYVNPTDKHTFNVGEGVDITKYNFTPDSMVNLNHFFKYKAERGEEIHLDGVKFVPKIEEISKLDFDRKTPVEHHLEKIRNFRNFHHRLR